VTDPDDATRIREIIEVLRDCDQRPTLDAIARQFRYETGRDLPAVWRESPPTWLRNRLAEDEGAAHAHVGGEDRHGA
jgi:hypothetical protein